MVEKYAESMQKAMKSLQIADHMAYMTYPLVQDKRLLLKILDQVYDAMVNTINAILQYDYLWKRIQLYKDAKSNFQTFKEKCAPRYGITSEQISKILEALSLIEKHKRSPLEFARRDKIVIMTDNLRTSIIDIDIIKKYLVLSKQLIQSASTHISTKR
jgi:hypothetical protein